MDEAPPPPQKKPRKAKEPETPEMLEKKKLQKDLDAARRKVTKADTTLEQDKVAEDILKQGCDAGRSAKPALTAAKKKREMSEFNLAHAKKTWKHLKQNSNLHQRLRLMWRSRLTRKAKAFKFSPQPAHGRRCVRC